MRYVVRSLGYYNCPTFATLKEAREFLAALVEDSFAQVRRRYGRATKIKNGKDNYTIKIGGADAYNIWSSHWIDKA